MTGTVVKGIGGFYFVHDGDNVVMGKARGKLKRNKELIYVGDIVDYDISVSKQWDTYMWLIKEIDGWKSKKTTVEADNVDEVFDGISRALDNYQIKDETAFKKDKKVNFVKKEFKDKVLNADNSSQIDKITIKYKSE